jgi:ribosomal-protein-alanine N-acetyltransferase
VTTPASESSPGTPTVRQAVKADLLAIFRIEKASFPQPWPFAAFERYVGEPGFLVAEFGRGIAGYVVADSVPNHGQPLGHIKDIAVHPDQRGQGVGTLLLERSLGVLAAQGVASVKLEVRESNDTARSLYETFGFEHARTIPRYYDNGEDALVMLADIDGNN